MRDELFSYYVALGHTLKYLQRYRISARRIEMAYTGTLAVLSAGSILTMSIWEQVPVGLALITLMAQILTALKPFTQSAKQRSALKYILQDMNALFDEVNNYWDTVGAKETSLHCEEETAEKIMQWKADERRIAARFCEDTDFPYKKRLDKKAKEENCVYFWYHYNVKPEEELK